MLLSCDVGGSLKLFIIKSAKEVKELVTFKGGEHGHVGSVSYAVFSPDSKYIASCGYDKTIKVKKVGIFNNFYCDIRFGSKQKKTIKVKIARKVMNSLDKLICI